MKKAVSFFCCVSFCIVMGSGIAVLGHKNLNDLIQLSVLICILVPIYLLALNNSKLLVPCVMSTWAFAPELRRFIDWYGNEYSSLSFISTAPMLACLTLLIPALKKKPVLSTWTKRILILTVLVMGYGFFIGVLKHGFSAIYSFASYVVPMTVFPYVLATNPSIELRHKWIRSFVNIALLVSVYGWVQYMIAPAWDTFWMSNAGMSSIGRPYPMEIRVFSTLNAPGVTALFLSVALLAMFINKNWRGMLGIYSIPLVSSCLALTMVRSAWIMVAAALVFGIIFLLPRAQKIKTTLIVSALVSIGYLFISIIPGGNDIMERGKTLSSLDADVSYNSRLSFTLTMLTRIITSSQLGSGLGETGVGTKLSNSGAMGSLGVFDNGYLEIIYTFGLFVSPLIFIVLLLLVKWIKESLKYNQDLKQFSTLAFLVLFGLFVSLVASNPLSGPFGFLLWFVISVSLTQIQIKQNQNDKITVNNKPYFDHVNKQKRLFDSPRLN